MSERDLPLSVALLEAHPHCWFNRAELERSSRCGCFYCLRTFSPPEITDWVDDEDGVVDTSRSTGRTARCPHCGMDAVLASAANYPLTDEFLTMMRERWFETFYPRDHG